MQVIAPQPGQQEKAAKSPAQILVYGGGAGGGKTWFQAYRAAKYHRVKGYNAVVMRRTHKMLKQSGGVWDQCASFYPALGAVQAYPLWRWPEYGTKVEFSHLQHEKDALAHKSAQYAALCMDEATDFTAKQLEFMPSRVRTTCGVKTQTVFTTNPDPDSIIRELIAYWIASDGYPDPSRDGKLRFMLRINGERVWADSREALEKYTKDPNDIKSVTFIKSLVTDNRILMEADPAYIGNLRNLPPVEQARFLGGNWDIREAAGDYFQASWFGQYGGNDLERLLCGQTGQPWDIIGMIRFWDRAATPVQGNLVPGIARPADFKALGLGSREKEPDWTFGVKYALFRNGKRCIMDYCAYRDTPGAIEQAMIMHAKEDGPRCTVGYWQDPAQAGIDQAERMAKLIKPHAPVWFEVQHKTKQEYARDPSRAAFRGELMYLNTLNMRQLWNHLESFPDPKAKDDGVDALAGAELFFLLKPPARYAYEGVDRLQEPQIVRPNDRELQMYSQGPRRASLERRPLSTTSGIRSSGL